MTEWKYCKSQLARNLFKKNKIMTTQDLCDELGLSPDYARNVISRLAREGLIEDSGHRVEIPQSRSNRKTKLWQLRSQ